MKNGEQEKRYRESIIQHAILDFIKMDKARKIHQPMFINLTEWIGGPRVIRDAVLEANLDEAALEAIEKQDYAGTIMVDLDGKATMLDLSAHGEALKRENEADRILEIAHEQEKWSRFNER